MQNTSNYNLNIVEGTDIVNIPVQLNPNFQTIDSEMFKNKEGSVGTATEVVTGTVHAIVRANTDADVFRFTATGNWASGDTMTVDGGAVTVHLTDGTAPGAGAYVIGAEVVAVINGTLVTLISSSAAVDPGVTSFNSRTGAVSPTASDYDASMIDYDNTLSGLTATDVQSAIDELVGVSGVSMSILWINSDPSSDFDAQPIILSSSDYDLLLTATNDGGCFITARGQSARLSYNQTSNSTYITVVFRGFNYVSDTSYSATDCYVQNSGQPRSVANSGLKPLIIYGIKIS